MAIVSTELEVQDITTLPKRTASGIDPDTDFVLGVEENGIAYKADIEDLGQSIVQGAKSNLLGRNQTVASAFSMLREETNEKIKESYGAPLVANQASDMKDKTRVYVYTGHESGYHHHGWYYWNNVAWTLGDEYNAGIVTTDVTLTLADMPADAKAVGDALNEVNTELSSITDDVEQLQEDSSGYAASTSIAPEYGPSGIYAVGDYCMHDGALYRCTTAIATAEAWNASHWTADNVKNIADGLKGDVSDLKDDLNQGVSNNTFDAFLGANQVYATGENDNIIDLASQQDADYSSSLNYLLFGAFPITKVINQMFWFTPPFVSGTKYRICAHYFGEQNSFGSSNIRLFKSDGETLVKQWNAIGEANEAFEFTATGGERIRLWISDPNTFRVYSLIAVAVKSTFSSQFLTAIGNVIGLPLKNGGHINSSNYNTLIPDLNDAPVNTYYTGFTGDATKLPANCPTNITMPFTVKTYGTNGFIIMQEFTIYSNIHAQVNPSYFSGNTWVRCLTGAPGNRSVYYDWISAGTDWQRQINAIKVNARPVITVDKSATADEANLVYNNFYKAMKDAYANSYDVYVHAGSYDIIDEYIAVEGQSTYDAIANRWVGVPIGHGMTVKCSAQTYFVFKNTSAKSPNYLTIGQWFAVILPLDGGFRLEGFNCNAKNARYVIHDGGYNNANEFCNHEIINCQLYLDNTDFAGQSGLQMYSQVIGGGLLSGGIHVIIKDCIFESKDFADNAGCVSYHNVSDTVVDAESYNTYDISGCYFRTGTARCTYHGTETPVSPFKVHDNFLRSAPIFGAEVPNTDTIVNMEMMSWNNTVQASN